MEGVGQSANPVCGSEGFAGWVCVGGCQRDWNTAALQPCMCSASGLPELSPVDSTRGTIPTGSRDHSEQQKSREDRMRRQKQHKKRSAGLAGTPNISEEVKTNPERKKLHVLSGAFQESMRRRLVFHLVRLVFL